MDEVYVNVPVTVGSDCFFRQGQAFMQAVVQEAVLRAADIRDALGDDPGAAGALVPAPRPPKPLPPARNALI